MQFKDYLLAFGLGSLVVLASALPFVAAAVVAWWPGNRPRWKRRFVLASAVLVYGVAGIFTLLSLPFELFGTYISPQLEHDGHEALPSIIFWMYRTTDMLPYVVAAIGSIAVPVLGRRGMWARLCAGMANRQLDGRL